MKKLLTALIALTLLLTVSGCTNSTENTDVPETDLDYIRNKGTLVVGITNFEPMDYPDAQGEWIGFDADLAREVAKDLGVEIVFTEIEWDNKIFELENRTIDVVWNGMTLTDEVMNAMSCSDPYFNNAQVVVIRKDRAEQYATPESLAELSFAVESGSAGEMAAEDLGLNYTALLSQADTLMELNAGTSDAAIIDLLMAVAMTGENTSYPDLTYTLKLTEEQYGIGCRKGSDLASYLNQELAKFSGNGTLKQIADVYGLADTLIER